METIYIDGPCRHEDVENDVCQDCGEFMEEEIAGRALKPRYDDDYFVGRKEKKEKFSYENELSNLDLPKEICKLVCEQISSLQEKTHIRHKTYITNLFVMIYISFNRLEMEFNPFLIGEKLKMDQQQIRAAIRIAAKGIDNRSCKNPICVLKPSSFLEQISSLFNDRYKLTDEQITNLKKFITLILIKNKMIENENPRGVAATVLKMFYDYNKIQIPDFFEKISRTPGYIKTMESFIHKTLNSFQETDNF